MVARKRRNNNNNNKNNKNKKKKDNNEVKIKAFHNKPRHGLRFECEYCGIKTVGGGYESLDKRDNIEKEARKEHNKLHKLMVKSGKGRTITVEENGRFVKKIPPLKITRYTHKVEAEHTFQQQTTRQFTVSSTYATPTGCSIASNAFDVGQTYLIFITAHIDAGTSTSFENKVRVTHGSTVFTDSEMVTEIDTASLRHTYMWWVVWTAVSGEAINLQLATATTNIEVGVDQVCMLAFRLTPDLVLNTDFRHAVTTTDTVISIANTDTTGSNNATITHTPTVADHRWLILSKARYSGVSNTTSPQTRISRSGEAVDNDTIVQQEGEDPSLSQIILCGARVDTLGAASNTYTEISKNIATPTLTPVTRTDSGIFMLDLDKFRSVQINNEDSPQEAPNSSTTNYAELVHSQSITPAIAGNVWIMAFLTVDWGGENFSGKLRLQIDDGDQPTTQSTDLYNFKQWDNADRLPWAIHTVENLTAAAHTADIDGSIVGTGQVTPGSYTRLLVLMSFELAIAANEIDTFKNETEVITETVRIVLGTAGKQVKNETETITETVIPVITSTLNLIQDENITFWFSGGSSNVDPANSLGGPRSLTPTGEGGGGGSGFLIDGFLDDGFLTSSGAGGRIINKLFDDVSLSEATTGDIEYRCFYVVNNHSTLTASTVKIWIPVNTPGQDEVDIALGSSGVNGTEQGPVTDENTAPNSPPLTFVTANSEATAINCGTLPPGQHRAIWLRRIVPAGAAFFPGNNYQLQVSLYSDHS